MVLRVCFRLLVDICLPVEKCTGFPFPRFFLPFDAHFLFITFYMHQQFKNFVSSQWTVMVCHWIDTHFICISIMLLPLYRETKLIGEKKTLLCLGRYLNKPLQF